MGIASGVWLPHTFLGRLDPEVASAAVALGRPRSFQAHEHLLIEGESSEHVFILLSGSVKVTAGTAPAKEVLLAVRVAGDAVGDLASMGHSPRCATVTACRLVTTRKVAASTFHTFLVEHPVANAAFQRMLGDRLRSSTQHRVELGGCLVPIRITRILVEFIRRYGRNTGRGRELAFEMTQPELAAAAGCAEASVRDVLKKLREAGIVTTSYRRITVLDAGALGRFAGLDDVSG